MIFFWEGWVMWLETGDHSLAMILADHDADSEIFTWNFYNYG